MPKNSLTQDYLKQILNYNPDTGIFRWVERVAKRIEIGQVAGSVDKGGYRKIRIGGVSFYAHRLAWLYSFGEFPKEQIDHINHIKDDNFLKNLRSCTSSENSRNRGMSPKNTSGYKGVSWHIRNKKWTAKIQHNRKTVNLGNYDCRHEAAKEYDKKALELFGEFACLNM